jgi:tRNA pseudouridine65 synthase
MSIQPEIISETEDWVAVAKPSGWVTHRSEWDRASQALLQWVRDYNGGHHVYAIHRLDRATSGVVLFAKNPKSAAELMTQFGERTAQKIYFALVRGFVKGPLVIDSPLRAIKNDETKGDYEEALTQVEVLGTGILPVPLGPFSEQRLSLLKLMPKTGRTHQLRRHLVKISHPIVGDTKYGDSRVNKLWRTLGQDRLALHAYSLTLTQTGTLVCKVPSDIVRACQIVQWQPEESEKNLQATTTPHLEPFGLLK